jgi:LysR family hydrogen peroxide-inducible transcriptional activator
MEMHQLRYVVAVARAGNFSRAAEQCHVSQPSLSQQIHKLEDELGERLFDRGRRAVRLTGPGEAFLGHAVRILDEVDAARREASEAGDQLRGTLTVGVLPTIAPYLLPRVLTQFLRSFPAIEVVLRENTTATLLKLARAGEIDLALLSRPVTDERLELRDLFTEELLLTHPAGHAFERRPEVSLADLYDEKFILMQEGHCLGDQVLSFCKRGTRQLRVSFRSAQLETIKALVAVGMGVSLVPAMAAAGPSGRRLKYRSLKPPRPQRTVVAGWPARNPPGRAALEFLKLVQMAGGGG